MIPVKLQLRNFMCYRENVPPLDFTGIHLACLSGDNGNGKSAVIDAITWAVWGKARAGSIDDLIFATATEMEVQFDFNVGQDLYRVVRKRTRPRKRTGAGQSSLEFQVQSGDSFRAISGNTIDETQRKIIETLHMDYDTFVNSAYLRQGHADEFTRQPPGKRKDVLGTILGLETYDVLEEKARTLARGKENECQQIESAIRDMTGELDRRADYQAEFEQAQATLADAEKITQEKETALRGLRSRLETLENQQSQLDALDRQMESNRRLLQSLEQQVEEHRAAIARYQEIIERKADIEKGYADYQAVKKTCDELAEKYRRFNSLREKQWELEKAVDQARNSLLQDQNKYQGTLDHWEERVSVLPELREQLGRVETEMASFRELEGSLAERESALRDEQQKTGLLQADITRLEREITEIGEKLDLLAKHRESHTDARCPLCESELTREGLDLIESKYRKEQEEKNVLLVTGREGLEKQTMTLSQLRNEHTAASTGLREKQQELNGRLTVLRKDIGEREAEEPRLVKGKEYVAGIVARLETKDYALDEQRELAAKAQELAVLGYDEGKHKESQEQLTGLQSWEAGQRKLEEAERLLGQEQAAEQRAGESAQGLRDSLAQDAERREKMTTDLQGLPEVRDRVAAAEKEYREVAEQRSRAQETVGRLRERLERLTELEAKRKEREAALAAISKEAGVYKELSRAFGKSGIQAFLIDMAIPDIESEANRLLTRMTDNRMHVTFETQQETRSGTVRETLDIFITDELGTRDYEMFSGGEAFRINFAIRIALSRLLARRAGAPLPTLIIDEGFGTQDSTGMEKLKEAINSIQDDFEKVLVITHMDDLKDAFPTRIDVVKTAEGSSITVN